MKGILLLIFLFTFGTFVSGQNTWVQKLSYYGIASGFDDTLTGVKEIQPGLDSSMYILATVTREKVEKIFKLSLIDHTVLWSINIGSHPSANQSQWCSRFSVTSDSGIIICFNFYINMIGIKCLIKKYDKTGQMQWSYGLGNNYWDTEAYDVLEKQQGGYLALINDSVFEFDNSGSAIDSSDVISGRRFIRMTNGDFLLLNASAILTRTDSLGNIIWSHPCDGPFGYNGSSVFISNTGSSIQKVDALSGIQVWNKNYGYTPISEIDATANDGFVASIGYKPGNMTSWGGGVIPGVLFSADYLGDTLWTRTFTIPWFGLSTARVMPDKSIATGGGYIYFNLSYGGPFRSAFCALLDSTGNGDLLHTDYTWPGDANNNDMLSIADDALSTMLALGFTGPVRDTIDWSQPMYYGHISDYAVDWNTAFMNGMNHKHADFDGNGIVDTNDVYKYGQFYSNILDSFIIPDPFRVINPSSHQFNTEDIYFIPEDDTMGPGTVRFYVVAGSSANPIDSIYGLSFRFYPLASNTQYVPLNSIDSVANDLGIFNSNLFSFHHEINNLSTVLYCRMDYQNCYNLYDTLGTIDIGVYDTGINTTCQLVVPEFHAVLWNGTEIQCNVYSIPVTIDMTLNTSKIYNEDLHVFPNPADNELQITFEKNKTRTPFTILIFNLLGEKVKTISNFNPGESISVADLPEGFYTGKLEYQSSEKNFSFIVHH
jgi:hypothetical protein